MEHTNASEEQERELIAPTGAEIIARAIKCLDGAELAVGAAVGVMFTVFIGFFVMLAILDSGKGELAGCQTLENHRVIYVATTPECFRVLQSIVKGEKE